MSVKEIAMGRPILQHLPFLSGEEGSGGEEESASKDEVRCNH
jgi:hypothetical protein